MSVARILPTTEDVSGFFWTSGADGKLRPCPGWKHLASAATARADPSSRMASAYMLLTRLA